MLGSYKKESCRVLMFKKNDLPSYSFSIWQEWFLDHMMDMKLAMPCFYSPGPFIGATSKHARRKHGSSFCLYSSVPLLQCVGHKQCF